MNKYFLFIFVTSILAIKSTFSYAAGEHKTLEIGAQAPDFKLKGIDGKMYSLSSFKNSNILAIAFTCNHCPTAQAYEDRIIQLSKDYSKKGMALIAVMPNDPKSVQLSELGYADLGDSFEEMKLRAKRKNFNFPYLFDGETEAMSKEYGPVATPHIFIFDKERKLRYQGRIDDVEKPPGTPKNLDAKNAIEALLANKEVLVKTTKVFGCSIKWAEKEDMVAKADAEWAKQPVSLDTIDEAGLKDLLKNTSDKLRLINVWATWCGPCVTEFPSFVTINRMYRARDFEFISISADNPEKKDKVLKFLQKQHAASPNYLFSVDDKYKLIEAIDPKWQGALPYTVLVEPGGKIVYAKQGTIDPAEMKTMIVDNHLIGRFY
ncbi:redoxin family protein [Segetibacter koreensis]|uniref:redoxin family protein n=1 Tax=Segetibacter koreensis TaxID=398037 RepID=UPI00036646B0|nr:redoxin family protein [Segetibacter koreensis]